nr:MAG TPA: hypothetical protein [Caudoviricetes sp.]
MVPHINDARYRRRGQRRADSRRLSSDGYEIGFVVYFLSFPDFSEARGFGSLIRHP